MSLTEKVFDEMTELIVFNQHANAHFDSKLATTDIVGTEGSLAAKDSCPLVASFGTLWWQKEMQRSYRCSFSSKNAAVVIPKCTKGQSSRLAFSPVCWHLLR